MEHSNTEDHAIQASAPRSEREFSFGSPDNFTLLIDRCHISVFGGKPCRDYRFDSSRDEQEWIAWQLGFYRHVLERLERYAELRLAELVEKTIA